MPYVVNIMLDLPSTWTPPPPPLSLFSLLSMEGLAELFWVDSLWFYQEVSYSFFFFFLVGGVGRTYALSRSSGAASHSFCIF